MSMRNSFTNGNSRTGERGSVLIAVMVAIFIIASTTTMVLYVTANAIHLNRAQELRAIAFNAAESGAERGYQTLRDYATPPTQLTAFDPLNGVQTWDAQTNYQVTIYPDPDNATQYLKIYRIVSTATTLDATKTVELVVRQASFGRYAYFTDKETSSITGGAIWWKAGETVDGPVHSNNTSGSNFSINYTGSTAPIFLDVVTAAGSSINYNPSTPNNQATWQKIFANGSTGFKLGVPAIQLPTSTDIQKNAAWGSSSGFPGTDGVYVKSSAAGGIYIRGDATIQMQLDASNNQQMVIKQGSNTTTITVNLTNGTTTYTGPVGSGSSASGGAVPNGVIYCTGNITSLKGVIADNKYSGTTITTRNAWTIATDVNNSKDITITDDLTYRTKPDKNQPTTATCNLAAGTLGLVAHNTVISTAATGDVEIDAVMLSGGQNTTDGSFYAANYDSRTPANLTVLGGVIQKARGPVGTFNASTGQTTTGFTKNYHYDPRLSTNPPPFYPTTGQYERLSWQLMGQ